MNIISKLQNGPIFNGQLIMDEETGIPKILYSQLHNTPNTGSGIHSPLTVVHVTLFDCVSNG